MSLLSKAILIIGSVLLIFGGFLYTVSHSIFMESYLNLERDSVDQNVERALNAVSSELSRLHSISVDWAHWTDTYDFMAGANENYAEENLLDEVFAYYRLDFMIFVDTSGRVHLSQGFDRAKQAKVPVSPDLLQFASDSALLKATLEKGETGADGIYGVDVVHESGFLFAATPITRSDLSGPVNGMLFWGSYIDEALIEMLAVQTEMMLSIRPISSRGDANRLPLLNGDSILVEPTNEEQVAGYTLLRDRRGNAALMLSIDMPRAIYRQGETTIAYFGSAFSLFGLVGGLCVIMLLHRGILSRLARLNDHVGRIQVSGNVEARVQVSGNDEITSLSRTINAMLESLQAEEKIKLARDNALEAARIKTEILANVSHDARTPLTTIMLRSEMLAQGIYGSLNDKQKSVLGAIVIGSRQLLHFVNNLLEGAQLEQGNVALRTTAIVPAKLLASTVELLSPLAAAKQLRLETEIVAGTPDIICGDERRIDQIMTNLIGNAIKFTESGVVKVRIFGLNAERWGIEVKDTGPGIAPDHLRQIFTPFWQVDGSKTRSANLGVGLGLSIVQQLTELMGGEIHVDSAVGAGTTFTVTLPVDVTAKGAALAEPAYSSGG